MVLKDIMAISGEPGLFRFIAQGKNAMIVEHLETKKRTSAFGSAKVSSLDEITVFTEKEDKPLREVFDLIYDKENGGPSIDHKSDPEKLKEYLNGILPEYDKSRVYVSDIKKMVHWYNILHSLNMLVKEEPPKPEEPAKVEKPEDAQVSAPGDEPQKKAVEKKKAAPKKEKQAGQKKETASARKPAKSKDKK